MKTLNKLEELQKEQTSFEFIKSYPILNKINGIRLNDIRLLELVLSYQENDKEFYMGYDNIGKILSLGTQTVKDIVCRLNKSGVITSTNSKNYNGTNGGSSSTLYVNLDVIVNLIKGETTPTIEVSKSVSNEPSPEPKVVTPEVKEESTDEVIDDTTKKLLSIVETYYEEDSSIKINDDQRDVLQHLIKTGDILKKEILIGYINEYKTDNSTNVKI